MTKRNGHLRLDPKNARRHSDRNKKAIRQSLEAVGGGRSILVDGQNIIRAGNGVYEQAQELGLKVRIVDAGKGELIAVRRKDLKGKEAIRAAMLDNLAADSSYADYDAEILAAIAKDDELVRALANEDKQTAGLISGKELDDPELTEEIETQRAKKMLRVLVSIPINNAMTARKILKPLEKIPEIEIIYGAN